MKKPKVKSVQIHYIFPEWLKIAIDEQAAKKGITSSEYARDAIKAAIEKDISAK
jgi:hypothetical protein